MTALLIEAAPPGELTREGARLRTDRLRGRLATAWGELQDLIAREAWRVLGYDTLADWMQAEFGDLRLLRISKEQSEEIIRAMHAQGMRYRQIRDALGVSLGKISGALTDTQPAPVVRLVVDEAPRSKREQVLELIGREGDRGKTCLELEHETGWRHGVASSPVSYHASPKSGRLRATGQFRDGYAVYVTT